jgi:hypothetical protein
MPLHLVRRWIVRHPLAWVLGLALALAGAQTAGVVHEISHGLNAVSAAAKAHAGTGSECVTCLAAAALGGAAPAPVVAALPGGSASAAPALHADTSWAPAFQRAYASRAPPVPHSA